MFRNLVFALILALIGGLSLSAQDVAQTSVVTSNNFECSNCQGCDMGCRTCERSFPAVTNQDIWSQPPYSDCSGGRIDWIEFDDFCPKKYFSIFGGYTNIDNFERRLLIGASNEITTADMLDGWGIGAALGRQMHPLVRIETEFNYRDNVAGNWEVNTFTGGVLTASTVVDATGSLQTFSWLNNVIVDFPPRKQCCPNLYAGGGIGIMHANGNIATATTTYNISDSSFAYQFIGGINVPVRDNVDLFAEYRYMGANNVTVDDVTNAVSLGDFNFDSHNVFFGMRVFGR